VSDLGEGTNLFPTMETGSVPGSVGIAWYGAANERFNNDACNWRVYFAQTLNAKAATPTFTQVEASDHVIHASNISEGGLNGSSNRNLIDYFQITFDPQGAAVIGFTDDHNDFNGHTYVTRQIAGPGANGAAISLPNPLPSPTPPSGPDAFPPPQPGPAGEQVTDFELDAASGSSLARISTPNPTDIVSIKYTSTNVAGPKLILSATMKLSLLPAAPPSATYRMNFTANAPDAVLSASGDNTYGISDRGDQFFVSVTTDAQGAPTYRYGTAVRTSAGAITYTNVGIADGGAIDQANQTVRVDLDVAKLNTILSMRGRPIVETGSVLVGLRGSSSAAQQSDETRGGTIYKIGAVTAASAVSRKSHGNQGAFDVPLPLFGNTGIECRTGGAAGNYSVVVKFFGPVQVAGASSSAGTATATPNGEDVIVNLTGVPQSPQLITITLQGVNDGLNTADVTIPMRLLIGDTNGDGSVNSGDSQQTRSRSGQLAATTNFRSDVNADGAINSGDASVVRSRSGSSANARAKSKRVAKR
jgi:hypothetical protein